jgi:hypothetical protein
MSNVVTLNPGKELGKKILHFIGHDKINRMKIHLNKIDELENINDYETCKNKKETFLNDVKKIVLDSNVLLEGNCFYYHNSFNLCPELYNKQLNIFCCGKKALTKICEIGFNAGHSCMLMLLGRDKSNLDFTVFDIGNHAYTKPCLNYVKSQFPNVNFEYIEGDSTINMPKWIELNKKYLETYDLVHVDGGHTEHCILNDMKNADLLVKKGGVLIVDDTNMHHVNKYVDLYVQNGKYKEMNVLKSTVYPHRILQKI